MKKTICAAGILGLALSANAISYTFSDADWFGSLNANNIPSGVHMVTGTGTATVSGSFNFVTADGTSSFKISTPYLPGVLGGRGTYSSALGFTPGIQQIVPGTLAVAFFFRDPSAGNEAIQVSSGSFGSTVNNIVSAQLVGFGGGESAAVDVSIDSFGILNYTVKSLGSAGQEVYLDAAYASFDAQDIPDGGSMVLALGLAVMSFEGIRRSVKRA